MSQRQYFINLMNTQRIPYSVNELRLIIEQRVPCGTFSITACDGEEHAEPSSRGVYIKQATDPRSIKVVVEQGTCQGLMLQLIPEHLVYEGACAATSYTVQYMKPRTRDLLDRMIRSLTAHKANVAPVEPGPTIVVTWDEEGNEEAWSREWREEVPKHLDCVAQSVLKTIKSFDNIERVPVPFDSIFFDSDEILSSGDVEDALRDLEAVGLVALQDDGYILKTCLSLKDGPSKGLEECRDTHADTDFSWHTDTVIPAT
jgi:hypothetical protein